MRAIIDGRTSISIYTAGDDAGMTRHWHERELHGLENCYHVVRNILIDHSEYRFDAMLQASEYHVSPTISSFTQPQIVPLGCSPSCHLDVFVAFIVMALLWLMNGFT